jgi:SPP1 family predicted phage head-tail adaptor
MRGGKLRHRFIIQRRTVQYDARGHETTVWTNVGTPICCEVLELSGRELERARQLVAEATVQIKTRRSDVLATDRIKFNNRILQVYSVVNSPAGDEQTILCAEPKTPVG